MTNLVHQSADVEKIHTSTDDDNKSLPQLLEINNNNKEENEKEKYRDKICMSPPLAVHSPLSQDNDQISTR